MGLLLTIIIFVVTYCYIRGSIDFKKEMRKKEIKEIYEEIEKSKRDNYY